MNLRTKRKPGCGAGLAFVGKAHSTEPALALTMVETNKGAIALIVGVDVVHQTRRGINPPPGGRLTGGFAFVPPNRAMARLGPSNRLQRWALSSPTMEA